MRKAKRGGIAAQFNLEDPEQREIYHLLMEWLEDRKRGNKDYNPRHLITDMALELIETGREPKKGDPLRRMQSLLMHEIAELKQLMMQGVTMVAQPMQADVEMDTEEVGGDVLAAIFSDHRAMGGR